MTDRVVLVNRQALALLRRAGITPPDAGPFTDVGQIDAKLTAAGLGVSERMELKNHLRVAGLLPAGRPINDRRP